MRVPVDLQTRSFSTLEGLFFDTALDTSSSPNIMRSEAMRPRCAADDDWILHRDLITLYYVDDDLPLKEVIRLMEEEHGFRSTPKVYKTKISEWGVQKYLTRAQREAAILLVEDFVTKHGYPPKITMNGRPISISRLRRHSTVARAIARGRRPPEVSSESSTYGYDDSIELSQALSQAETSVPPSTRSVEWLFTPPPEAANTEKLLRCVSVFTTFCADQYFPPTTHLLSSRTEADLDGDPTAGKNASEFWSSLIISLNKFEMGNRRSAFAELDSACQRVSLFIHLPPASLFRYLLIVLGNSRWDKYSEVRHHILAFLTHMATRILGAAHPVSISLGEMRKEDVLFQSAEPMMKITIRETEARLGPTHTETLWQKRSLMRVLRRQGDVAAAEALLQTAKNDAQIATGSSSRRTRICLEGLGQLYLQDNRLDDAEAVLVQLVRESDGPGSEGCSDCQKLIPSSVPTDSSGGKRVDHMALYAQRTLSFLAQARGNDMLQRYWFAQELEMIRECGIDEEWAMALRRYQEQRYFETGKFKYLTHLKGHVLRGNY